MSGPPDNELKGGVPVAGPWAEAGETNRAGRIATATMRIERRKRKTKRDMVFLLISSGSIER